jgi:hypothetical protein
LAGHIARLAVNTLRPAWNAEALLADRMAEARRMLEQITAQTDIRALVEVARKNANPQMDLMDEEDVTPLRA